MVKIELKNVNFEIDGHKILSNINLTLEDKSYNTIVGPTGAGKSELIAIIAGLYQPTSGLILFDGKDVTKVPANERNTGFMFESYALFPHLSVLDNISYGQHMKTNEHTETYHLGKEVLDLVRLSGRGSAIPKELSGGMKQRTALARALMALEEGGLLMIDEPFKALDAGLRFNLRREVHKIAKNRKLSLTTLHVTNDMEEAMMGDSVIVLDSGQIMQVGSPDEIMYSPKHRFVAEFFSTELNEFTGKILSIEKTTEPNYLREKEKQLYIVTIQTDLGCDLYAKTELNGQSFNVGDEVDFLIRPQYYKIRSGDRLDKSNSMLGKVSSNKFMGAWLRMDIILDKGKKIKIEVPTTNVSNHLFKSGEHVILYYASEFILVFPHITS